MNARTWPLAALLATAAIALAACTQSAPLVATGPPARLATPTPSRPAPPRLAPSIPVATPAVPQRPAALPPATAFSIDSAYVESAHFILPSRRVACIVTVTGAMCDVAQRTFTPPPKPAGCEFDWAGGVHLGLGKAEFTCGSDTLLNESMPVLPYGESVRVGRFGCLSTKEGVRCARSGSRHGFLLSVSRYSFSAQDVPSTGNRVPREYVSALVFTSPSRNISCVMYADGLASCAIERYSFTPPKIEYCDGRQQPLGVTLGRERAYFNCGGSVSTMAKPAVLAYGESLDLSGIRCDSARNGMTCAVSGGTHRFRLSESSYDLA